MKRLSAVVLAGFLITVGAGPGLSETSSALSEEYDTHPPIRITENIGPQGFVVGYNPVTGEPIYRPGSGVIDGSGSAEDPYVIAGWEVKSQFSRLMREEVVSEPAIVIDGTDAYVEIRQNRILADEHPNLDWEGFGPTGIELERAENVEIQENEIGNGSERLDPGIEIDRPKEVAILSNTFEGTADAVEISSDAGASDSVEARVHGNEFIDVGFGIDTYRTKVEVTGNKIDSYCTSIYIDALNEGEIAVDHNEINSEKCNGVHILSGDDISLRGNTISAHVGIAVTASEGVNVDNNALEFSGDSGQAEASRGIFPHLNSSNVKLTDNNISGFDHGIQIGDDDRQSKSADELGYTITRNNIWDNKETGIKSLIPGTLIAEENWWGCPDGPDDSLCDDAEGDIDFSPWLESPNPDAGTD